MLKLDQFFQREHNKSLYQEGKEREFGQLVFSEWRDRYMATVAKIIRWYNDCERADITLEALPRSKDWYNAALHIVVVGDEYLQDYFLRSDQDRKDEMVNCVLLDGGICDLTGFFVELPPC